MSKSRVIVGAVITERRSKAEVAPTTVSPAPLKMGLRLKYRHDHALRSGIRFHTRGRLECFCCSFELRLTKRSEEEFHGRECVCPCTN